jgi:hypothetical protein
LSYNASAVKQHSAFLSIFWQKREKYVFSHFCLPETCMYCSYQFYEELGLFEDQRYQRLVETSAGLQSIFRKHFSISVIQY